MKNLICILPVLFLFLSCGQKSLPPELIGQWRTEKIRITIRTEPAEGNFKFISDSAIVTLIIKSDFTASGSIGNAIFKNARFKKNWVNPEKTGIAFIVKCGAIAKIFENDPLEKKEVELWLGPLKETMDSELRYTQEGAHIPMAGMIFSKKAD